MINTDRIVPVTAIDLISLYGLILKAASVTLTAINPETVDGQFAVEAAANALICSQPVKSLDFDSSLNSATVYFVPAYDYAGFTKNGAAVTKAGVDVVADGRTLYSATLSTSTVTFAKVGF
ncbi:MAG: hypothetical protein J6U66_06075 [Lachnospiraceae bacterium]|nr:hypothetical protein [Lachnospiraceae bacterium]